MKKLDVQTIEEIAEYMALARGLTETDSSEKYIRANMLNWKLAMQLPADLYRTLIKAIANPSEQCNPLTVISLVRTTYLNNIDDRLDPDEISHHAPGIGKVRNSTY